MMAAAAPQVGGQAISRVITPGHITGAAITLVFGHDSTEQRHRVVRCMATGLGADLREGGHLRAVLLHVGQACATEVAQRERHLLVADQLVGDRLEMVERTRPVIEHGAQRAGAHVLEAERQHAIGRAADHGLPRKEQRGRAGRAVVVDVDDRNAGHAHLVQRALAGGGVAVHVAHVGLLYQFIADAGVLQRGVGGMRGHLRVRLVGTGLG
jgi:hypothetical protein